MPRRPSTARKPAGRYHHGELRHALLDAAAAVVEREGIGALSLRELARRLGVSHAAPAHHFADRTALLAALAADGYARFGAALADAARRERDPFERLFAVGRAYVQFALDHPGRFRVMFGRELSELDPPPCPPEPEGGAAWQVLLDTVRGVLEVTAPERRADAEGVAFACWATVHGAAMLWLDGPLRAALPPAEARARFEAGLEASLAMIGAALRAPGRPPPRRR
ncbi:MAG TPA: TetR-like C-terminal domain-containing protein [Anaeromyxobacteraceae bacterium]|nr:TetR-like C-terminal domain-containing protein [Anaeromyxobacteraceae bacterium]